MQKLARLAFRWSQAPTSAMAAAPSAGDGHTSRALTSSRHAPLELFPLWWNQLSFDFDRIFDGEPDPLRLKML
jgi:hypothetical protein